MFRNRRLAGGVAVLVLMVTSAAARGDEKPRSIVVCADFTLFPDNHKFPDHFTYGSFKFNKLGGTLPLIVNQSGKDKGLQFPEKGVEVTLPVAVPAVDLNLGAFAGEVKIEALDETGQVIDTQRVPHTNKFNPVTVKAPAGGKIASMRFTAGGNEGNLASICVKLAVVP